MHTGPARTPDAPENESELSPIDFGVINRCPYDRRIWSQGKIGAGSRLYVVCPRHDCKEKSFVVLSVADGSVKNVKVQGRRRARLMGVRLEQKHGCITCGHPYAAGELCSGTALFIVCSQCKTQNRHIVP